MFADMWLIDWYLQNMRCVFVNLACDYFHTTEGICNYRLQELVSLYVDNE
jgi:hypothetical protein